MLKLITIHDQHTLQLVRDCLQIDELDIKSRLVLSVQA